MSEHETQYEMGRRLSNDRNEKDHLTKLARSLTEAIEAQLIEEDFGPGAIREFDYIVGVIRRTLEKEPTGEKA